MKKSIGQDVNLEASAYNEFANNADNATRIDIDYFLGQVEFKGCVETLKCDVANGNVELREVDNVLCIYDFDEAINHMYA